MSVQKRQLFQRFKTINGYFTVVSNCILKETYILLQSCQGTTMKMLENSHLLNINSQFHVLPMQLYLRHAEPTFMKAQKCPIYLGIHTYNTFKSAFTVITTPIAKLIHCCLLQLYTCYAIFVYCKIILYTRGCALTRNFTLFLLMNSAAA